MLKSVVFLAVLAVLIVVSIDALTPDAEKRPLQSA